MHTQSKMPLQCSLLARPGGQPVEEFLLVPFGHVRVDRALSGADFVFQRRHAESALRWFERMGRKLAIDYEHQTFDRFNTRPDGLRPAAGWIGRLEIRDDGLWACDVAWTERAKELLRTGEYQYFSPVIYWTDEDYTDVAALGPVALTNDPAMQGARPLVAAREEGLPVAADDRQVVDPGAADRAAASHPAVDFVAAGEATACSRADEYDDKNTLAADPTLDTAPPESASSPADSSETDSTGPANESAAAARRAALRRGDGSGEPATDDDDTRVAVLRAEIDVLHEEIEMLQRQLRAQEADAFVERGMRLGKIIDATSMDWRADYQRNPAETEARLARAPVLLPPGRFIARDFAGAAVPLARAGACSAARSTAGSTARRDVEPEDLDAYERARAAGRVRRFP